MEVEVAQMHLVVAVVAAQVGMFAPLAGIPVSPPAGTLLTGMFVLAGMFVPVGTPVLLVGTPAPLLATDTPVPL